MKFSSSKAIPLLLVMAAVSTLVLAGCGKKTVAVRDEVIANVPVSEPVYTAAPEAGADAFVIPNGTTDLDENPVSGDIFSRNTLTMVNIWGSFCGPCISEMPLLQSLHTDYAAQGFAIVGLLGDAVDGNGNRDADTIDLGKSILASSGVTYTNIAMSAELLYELEKHFPLEYYPTTIFVDSLGNIVGETIIGAVSEDEYRMQIEAALAQAAK